jgi:FKBP-type peptidyl-prolyl cis-trans isomerase
MARKRDRAFALFGALLFLVTSSALTIAVIYTLVQQHDQNQAASQAAAAATKAQTKTSTAKQTKLTGTIMQGFTPTTTPQIQLKIEDTKAGTGATVKAGDTITADYVGALMSTGVIFDASADHGGPQTFPLSGVIAGWSQGLPGMKVGGTRRLLIPASLAYGSQAQTGIPANSDLVFDVTVTKID